MRSSRPSRRSLRASAARASRAAALLLAAVLGVPAAGRAASQQPLSLQKLVELSHEIVVGKVTGSEARWQGRVIVTVTTIEVGEALKGRSPARIRITQPGGTAFDPRIGARVRVTASSQVALPTGEEVLLFVHRTPAGIRQIVGAGQGKFVIRKDPATGRSQLPIAPKRLEVLRGPDRDRIAPGVMTLERMRQRIRAALERSTQAPGKSAP